LGVPGKFILVILAILFILFILFILVILVIPFIPFILVMFNVCINTVVPGTDKLMLSL
jgi:hypothetical protein